MAVESATTIAALNALWPLGTDAKQEGDNHIRLIKSVLQADAVSKADLTAAIPAGTVVDYAGAAAPAGWLLCFGQAVSRTTYSALFTAIGTVYGTGDGTTTFNLPDMRGRTAAGKDNMGGTSADRLTALTGGVQGDTLGAVGGDEKHVLTLAQMASHDHTAATGAANMAHTHQTNIFFGNYALSGAPGPHSVLLGNSTGSVGTHAAISEPAGIEHTHFIVGVGSNAAHNNVQPTIVLNRIIKT